MQWGRSVDTLERAWSRHDYAEDKKPQALADRPDLSEEDRYLLGAYRVIARERPQSIGGVAGIPLSAVERYLRFWPEFDPVLFAEQILAIDDEIRATENKKAERKAKQ